MSESKSLRYQGFAHFEDNLLHRKLFSGRRYQTLRLLNTVLSEKMVVMYAKSGVGKTSLIKAGLKDPLRERKYYPIVTRIQGEGTPLNNLYNHIRSEAERDQFIEFEEGERHHLWTYFKTARFRREGQLMTPILIIDQFEELFTKNFPLKQIQELARQLASLFRPIKPPRLKKEDVPYLQYLSARMPKVKVIISLREDFLGHLDIMARQLPAILHNRFRLPAMPRANAEAAIREPAEYVETIPNSKLAHLPFDYEKDLVETLLNVLYDIPEPHQPNLQKDQEEPAQGRDIALFELQLICEHIENHLGNRPNRIATLSEFGGRKGLEQMKSEVIQAYFKESLNQLESKKAQKNAREMCETHLISDLGYRHYMKENDIRDIYSLNSGDLDKLGKLLQSETRDGHKIYEIRHDSMVDPILKIRRTRRRKARNLLLTAFTTITLGLLLVMGIKYESAASKIPSSGNITGIPSVRNNIQLRSDRRTLKHTEDIYYHFGPIIKSNSSNYKYSYGDKNYYTNRLDRISEYSWKNKKKNYTDTKKDSIDTKNKNAPEIDSSFSWQVVGEIPIAYYIVKYTKIRELNIKDSRGIEPRNEDILSKIIPEINHFTFSEVALEKCKRDPFSLTFKPEASATPEGQVLGTLECECKETDKPLNIPAIIINEEEQKQFENWTDQKAALPSNPLVVYAQSEPPPLLMDSQITEEGQSISNDLFSPALGIQKYARDRLLQQGYDYNEVYDFLWALLTRQHELGINNPLMLKNIKMVILNKETPPLKREQHLSLLTKIARELYFGSDYLGAARITEKIPPDLLPLAAIKKDYYFIKGDACLNSGEEKYLPKALIAFTVYNNYLPTADLDQDVKNYRRVLTLGKLGVTYLKQGKLSEAEETLIEAKQYKDRTLSIEDLPEINAHMAQLLMEQKKVEDALIEINIALEYNVENTDFLLTKAQIYKEMGHHDGACAYYRKVMELEPFLAVEDQFCGADSRGAFDRFMEKQKGIYNTEKSASAWLDLHILDPSRDYPKPQTTVPPSSSQPARNLAYFQDMLDTQQPGFVGALLESNLSVNDKKRLLQTWHHVDESQWLTEKLEPALDDYRLEEATVLLERLRDLNRLSPKLQDRQNSNHQQISTLSTHLSNKNLDEAKEIFQQLPSHKQEEFQAHLSLLLEYDRQRQEIANEELVNSQTANESEDLEELKKKLAAANLELERFKREKSSTDQKFNDLGAKAKKTEVDLQKAENLNAQYQLHLYERDLYKLKYHVTDFQKDGNMLTIQFQDDWGKPSGVTITTDTGKGVVSGFGEAVIDITNAKYLFFQPQYADVNPFRVEVNKILNPPSRLQFQFSNCKSNNTFYMVDLSTEPGRNLKELKYQVIDINGKRVVQTSIINDKTLRIKAFNIREIKLKLPETAWKTYSFSDIRAQCKQ